MAGEYNTTKLNPDTHLVLDQPLLRLPHELVRKNFKNVQRHIERERDQILPALKETANASMSSSQSPEETLAALDSMIAKMQNLKRKLENLHTEEEALHNHSAKRIQHLQDLYEIPSLVDVKYDEWSRVRLDRLIVDYLLRSGYSSSAKSLANAKDISHLIDLDTFKTCHKIAKSLANGEVKEALAWVAENRNALKKLPVSIPSWFSSVISASTTDPHPMIPATPPQISTFEFELRFQQYIQLLAASTRESKLTAMHHANKHITPHASHFPNAVLIAAGLLAQPPTTTSTTYSPFYSSDRWMYLSRLFLSTHHALLSLPVQPLLHTALSAGLSALKTPACHSVHNPASSSSNATARIATNTSLCPICSMELNDLARNVPYAHHTKSHVENDAVVLPNGRIYGRHKLEELQAKIARVTGRGLQQVIQNDISGESGGGGGDDLLGKLGEVTDPTTGDVFLWKDVRKVYIT